MPSKWAKKKELGLYFKMIDSYPVLTADEERVLCVASHQGDLQARELLFRHNLRLVISTAKKYRSATVNQEDLVQVGMIGLLKAVKHFDPAKGNRFSAFASWYLDHEMVLLLRALSAVVHSTQDPVGRDPVTGCTVKVRHPRSTTLNHVRWGRVFSNHAVTQMPPHVRVQMAEVRREVDAWLAKKRTKRVDQIAAQIVRERFLADEPRLLRDIGSDWGISHQRVSQIETATRKELQVLLSAHDH